MGGILWEEKFGISVISMQVGEDLFLMYALPLNVSGANIPGDVYYPSNSFDFLGSFLINEGVSGSLPPYHELVHGDDLLALWGLLMCRKRLWGIQVGKRILLERLWQRRLGQLSSGYIFTTGLPQEDVDRYHSS